jgi:hypothetical protein
MPEIHFRSQEASQNKGDITDRFGDSNFILAVYTCSYVNATFSKLSAIPVRQGIMEFHFRSMEVLDIESDVTIQFLFGI